MGRHIKNGIPYGGTVNNSTMVKHGDSTVANEIDRIKENAEKLEQEVTGMHHFIGAVTLSSDTDYSKFKQGVYTYSTWMGDFPSTSPIYQTNGIMIIAPLTQAPDATSNTIYVACISENGKIYAFYYVLPSKQILREYVFTGVRI